MKKANNYRSRNSMAISTEPPTESNSMTRRSLSSLNLDNSERKSNDILFDTLMSDPIKRKMIMELLSQEKDNIQKYKHNEDKKKVTKLKRNERLLHCESPTALLRRRALEKNRRDSSDSSSTTTSDSRSVATTPIPFENLLNGVVAYVEIRSKDEDRSAGAKALMQNMGAKIRDNFTSEVTHVIFKDGSFTTYQKAKLKKVHLVSILWLEAVRKNNFRVAEKDYPALGTEAFDVNISHICSEYDKVVNEEKRRSEAISFPKGRKTALPSELQAIQGAGDLAGFITRGRISEVVIPTSQNWEAESVISCASGTLPYRRNIATIQETDSERFEISTPEVTSDDDSERGVINGESFIRELSQLDLDVVPENVNEIIPGTSGENVTTNTSSTPSVSLLHRKSERKSSYQLVDMDLTNNLNDVGKENINSGKEPAKKPRRDSSLLSDNSTNLLDGHVSISRSTDNQPNPSNKILFKEPLEKKSLDASVNKSLLPRTRSSSELIGNQKKNSVSSDETPSLRFSTSSKDTTDKKNNSSSIRISETNKNNRSTEEMPSLRISTSISSNDISEKKTRKSLNSEDMPSLRISSSSNETPVGRKTRSSMSFHSNKSVNGKNDSISKNELEKNKIPSRSSPVIKKTPEFEACSNENFPSLRISSNSSNETSEGRRTRSSINNSSNNLINGKVKAQSSSSNNNELEKKKRSSKSLGDDKEDSSTTVKKKRKSLNTEETSSSELPNGTRGRKRNALSSKEIQEAEKNQHNQKKTKKNSSSSRSNSLEDIPSLRISTSQSNDPLENLQEVTSKNQNKDPVSSNLELLSEDVERKTDHTRTRGSTQSLNDEDNSTEVSSNRVTRSKSTTDLQSNTKILPVNKKQKLNNNGKKKYRKLYNLNQSVEEILKDFEWSDNELNKENEETPTRYVVPKKPNTRVRLVPIAVTPTAKKLIEKRKKNENQVKKDKVPKKDPPKQKKKVLIDTGKDEQKELAEEYVNKTRNEKTNTDNENVDSERPGKISRKSQRLSQYKQKPNYQEKSFHTDSENEQPIRPELNRRSTFDFVQTSPSKSQKKRKRIKRTGIVCTRMHKPEVQTFMQIVRKLGRFYVEDEVTDKTTHLIVGESKRTINLLKALARGCWILEKEWLFRSLEASKWLPEEDYEVTDFSPAIQKCRIERHAFGKLYSMDIFENCGPIYIAASSIPRRSDLQELVQLCKGVVTNIKYNAAIVVGQWVRYENVTCVKEIWILDSITYNKKKSFKNYLIDQRN